MEGLLNERASRVFAHLSIGFREGNILEFVSGVDQLFSEIDSYIHKVKGELVSIGGHSLVYHGVVQWSENVWMDIVRINQIRPDFKFIKKATEYARNRQINVRQKYLDTWIIDEEAPYHGVLLGRMMENATFGTLAPYEWFAFLSGIVDTNKCVELRYIAGMVQRLNAPPFMTKHADKSVIDNVKMFYNMPNIVESLLNLCVMRLGMERHSVVLNGTAFDLYLILDEIALNVCISPKVIMDTIRKFVVYTVRYAGVETTQPVHFLKHEKLILSALDRASVQHRVEVDSDVFTHYRESTIFKKERDAGLALLKTFKLKKLHALCEAVLQTTLYGTGYVDYTLACAFLLRLVALPGYGRALNYASSPRSAPERSIDELGIGDAMRNMIIRFSDLAQESGYSLVDPDQWKQKCITFWKSTGAGVQPEKVKVRIDGEPREVTISKKMMIGAYYGNLLFRRSLLEKKYSAENPGNVGYRDVPGKATRAIYVLKLPTLHAQVATVSHMVDYVASSGRAFASANEPYDASHIHSGPGTTTGMRIFDNMDTITASSDPSSFYLGLDASSYDSNNVGWNFRIPIVEALRHIGKDLRYGYGDDAITWNEMIEYAYGEGHVMNTIWDNGREPIVYLNEDRSDLALYHKLASSDYVSERNVGPDLPKVRPMSGCKFIAEHATIRVVDIDRMIADSSPIPWDVLRVGVLRDGSDFVTLTSEASGELSTLLFNSLMNLSMQDIVKKHLHETTFGARIQLKTMKAVGDDSEWIGILKSKPQSFQEIDEFLYWLKTMYAKMGHTLKEENMILIPLGSEFVQTFSKFGLYIPRDLISIIPSEKPRKILDRMNFLYSLRNVFNAKISRGFSPIFCNMLYLYMYRKLSALDLRRHKIIIDRSVNILPDDNSLKGIGRSSFNWSVVKIRDVKMTRFIEFKKCDIFIVLFSALGALLPSSARGGYWNPVLFSVHNYDAFFLWWVSTLDDTQARSILVTAYSYMKSRDWKGSSMGRTKSDVRVEADECQLSMADVFSSRVYDFIVKKRVNIGRLDATNVPGRIIRKGMSMEKFMQPLQSLDLEVDSENFMKIYASKIPGFRFETDGWILNMEMGMQPDSTPAGQYEEGSRFFSGLPLEQALIRDRFGLIDSNERLSIGMDRLRVILSRDSALRSIMSPEEVVALLAEYSISESKDIPYGIALLRATGMEEGVANEVLGSVLNNNYGAYPSTTNGALTDDFSSALNIVNARRLASIAFPGSFVKNQKVHVMIHGAQMSLYNLIMHGEAFVLTKVSPAPIERRLTTVLGLVSGVISVSLGRNRSLMLQALYDDLLCVDIPTQLREQVDVKEIRDFRRSLVIVPGGGGKTQMQRKFNELIDIDEQVRLISGTDSVQLTRMEFSDQWLVNLHTLCTNELSFPLWNRDGLFMISHYLLLPNGLDCSSFMSKIRVFVPSGKILKGMISRSVMSSDAIKSEHDDLIKWANETQSTLVVYSSWSSLYRNISSILT